MTSNTGPETPDGTAAEETASAPQDDQSGYSRPLVRDVYELADRLRDEPDDIAALETIIGMLGGIQQVVGAIGGYEGTPKGYRLGAADLIAASKMRDASSALRFASGFLHEARDRAVTNQPAVDRVSTKYRSDLEAMRRFLADTYDTVNGPAAASHRVDKEEVTAAYAAWCTTNNVTPVEEADFLLFSRLRGMTGYFFGIRPKAAAEVTE
ncbi:hypothetical protein ACFWA1_35890 [Streptomyces sp. NPDC060005]|uniref:hypothetical protein n=1 Tax=Streptomyces sp. NPDC060005 TaxID=3347034 RepID=UPI00369BEF21